MKRDGLHIETDTTLSGDLVRRTVRLHEDGAKNTHEAVYEFERPGSASGEETLDGAVLAFLFHAMQRGRPLFVHGPLTRTALYNIEMLQGAWRCWRPARYKQVDVLPERIADRQDAKPGRKAIAAYSGGVDSTYTALRHRRHLPPESRRNLTSVLMVHGFDVSLDKPDHFKRLVERTRAFRDYLGLDLRVVRTNSKELYLQDWQDSHAAQLAACLHLFSDEFEFGLIGSTKSYDALVLPYGTSPVTDHLLSGDGFSIAHDGAEASRTEKVEVIAKHPIAVQALKVCWEGKKQFRNCGVCEKCVRTQLNFAAVGVVDPLCFEGRVDMRQIRTIPVRNEPQAAELRSIVDYARQHNVQGDWLEALKARIAAVRPEPKALVMLRAALRAARAGAVIALDAIGAKQSVKRVRDALRR
ncbi:MAG TPA: hypothetical protein VD978_11520 [Azospirillum sp.]|nr:hypothetical protein [Azospirillum sp.]